MKHQADIKSSQVGKDIDWWDNLSSVQKKDIEAGLLDLKNGRKKSFEKVMSKYK